MKTSSNAKWKLDKIEKAKIIDYLLLEEVGRNDIDRCMQEVEKNFLPSDERSFFAEVIQKIAKINSFNRKFIGYLTTLNFNVRHKRPIYVLSASRQTELADLMQAAIKAGRLARPVVWDLINAADKKVFENNRGMVGVPLQSKVNTEFCKECEKLLPENLKHIFREIKKNAKRGFPSSQRSEICQKVAALGFQKADAEAIFKKSSKTTAALFKGFYGEVLQQKILQDFYEKILKKLSSGATAVAAEAIRSWMNTATRNVELLVNSGKFAPQGYEPKGLTELDKVELTDFIAGKFEIPAKTVRAAVNNGVRASLASNFKMNNGQLKRAIENDILARLQVDGSIDGKIRQELKFGGAEKFFEQVESKDLTPFMGGSSAKDPLPSNVASSPIAQKNVPSPVAAVQMQQQPGLSEVQIETEVEGWVKSHKIPKAVAEQQLRLSDADGRINQRHLVGNDYYMKISKNGLLRVLMQTGIEKQVQISILKVLLSFNGVRLV